MRVIHRPSLRIIHRSRTHDTPPSPLTHAHHLRVHTHTIYRVAFRMIYRRSLSFICRLSLRTRERETSRAPQVPHQVQWEGATPRVQWEGLRDLGAVYFCCVPEKPLLTHCCLCLHPGLIAAGLTLIRQTVVTQNYSLFTT